MRIFAILSKSSDAYDTSFRFRGGVGMIAREDYLSKIKSAMWDGNIKVITGLRRCGKSTLLFELFYEYLISTGVKEESIIRLELDKRK